MAEESEPTPARASDPEEQAEGEEPEAGEAAAKVADGEAEGDHLRSSPSAAWGGGTTRRVVEG